MSYTALIKFAPIYTFERHNDPNWNRAGRFLFEAGALKFAPAVTAVPLLVDHDSERRIGTVFELVRVEWLDGPWLCARATVDHAPAWLRTRTKASFGFVPHNTRTYANDLIAGALVREVTVLSPGRKPAEPCAEVLLLRHVSPAAEVGAASVAAAGENTPDPTGRVLRRPGIGTVIAIR